MGELGTTFSLDSGKTGGADALLVPLTAAPKPALQTLARIDALCGGAVSELVEVGALGDEVGQLAHTTRAGAYPRVLLVSLGDDAQLAPHKLRQAAAAAAKWLTSNKIRTAALWIDGLLSCNFEQPVGQWTLGLALGGFVFNPLKKRDAKAVDRVRFSLRSAEPGHVARCQPEVREALLLAEAVNYARAVSHQPPNIMHTPALAAEARRLAKLHKLSCTVIDHRQAGKLGMNGLLAVGMAAAHKPCLIRLDYRGNAKARTNTVIVGKAVTFDTGGISIKPAAGMESMKFDKCGGTCVLGVMKAVATLRLKVNVIGLIAAAENTLSDEAYRPSDIIRMMSGKTVEIISTDAEGRMVLADALHYAQEQCDPTALIDLATLTGGIVTTLGREAAGIMSNDDELAGALCESGRRTHERLWRLPLWDEYRELIKGVDSDIRNSSGSRNAHAIVGGMFLKEFVKNGTPWAHLDIAGTATSEDSKYATGFGVRLLVDYLQRRS